MTDLLGHLVEVLEDPSKTGVIPLSPSVRLC